MLCVLSRLVSSSKTNFSCRDRIEIACGILSRPISRPKALALCHDRILPQRCILSRPRNPSMHQIFGPFYAAYNIIRRLYRISR